MSQWPGDEVEVRNRQTLEELAQTLEWSVGEFHLFLARCNYVAVRSQLITQLQDICSIRLQIITLTADTQHLYTTIRDAIAVSPDPPEGIIVVGFEQVRNLDRLFANADAAREEFRKQLPMPIVLWLDDPQFNSFKDRAPNFETWAPVDTPTFEIPTNTIIQSLQQGVEAIYAACFKPNQPQLANDPDQPLPKHVRAAIDVAQLGDLRRSELSQALQTLSDRAVSLPADLRADLHLVEGADAGLDEVAVEHFQACVDYWRSQVWAGQTNETTPAADLKLALALFFLGRFYFHNTDEIRRLDQAQYDDRDWQQARMPLEESLQLFEAADRPDMVAKTVRHLLGTLRRLQAWDDLARWLERAIPLHQQYHMLSRLAMDYGFLAELKLHQQDWPMARHYADLAVKTIQPLPLSQQWAEGLYLALQAKAEVQLGNETGAITLLEWARYLGDRGHPTIYSTILGDLRELYWQQKRYLEAFKLKQARLEVEKIAGIRAFVGAGRLGAQARLVEESDEPAPEIYASGRQLDLQELLSRINSTDSKLTVLHGDSGVGKSSLVNAGLIPALQKEPIGYRSALPVIVRQYMNWEKELATALAESIQVLSRSKVVQVPETIADILAMLRQCEQNNRCIVLVFDQFEEFFFANPDPVQRRQFFQFLSDCLGITYLNIILSLREDYLHYLLEASRALRGIANPPMLSQNLFGNILGRDILYPIGNFSPEQAKAIIADLTQQSRSYLEPDLVDALVADLAGPLQEVRPIELQIVGSQLETERIRSLAQYRELGDQPKEELVSRYLQEVVDDCGAEYEQIAELVLYLLTDERGTRPLKTRSDLQRELQVLLGDALTPDPSLMGRGEIEVERERELLPSPGGRGARGEGTLDYVLKILCGSGIVVYLPEDLDDRYQLVHDYIAETIRRQKAPQLEALMAELTEERQKRAQAEEELAAARVANRKAQRRLTVGTGVLVLSLIAALVAVPTAIRAIQTASVKTQTANKKVHKKDAEVERANHDLASAKKKTEQVEQEAKQAYQKAAQASLVAQKANQQVAEKEQQAEVANQQVRLAQQDLDQVRANLTSSVQAIQDAEARLTQAQQDQRAAQQALVEAQEQLEKTLIATKIEREGVAALRTFMRNRQLEGVIQGLAVAQRLKSEVQNAPLSYYPAYSPIFSLQQMLYASAERPLFQEQNRLDNPQGTVYSVSFSPDGQRIATASADRVARIWSRSGALLGELKGHQRPVLSASFSPDSQRIATTSGDYTVRIWNLNGNLLQELKGHQNIVRSANFSPDGQQIATASDDSTARIWSLDGKLLQELSGHQGIVWSVSFSPDGQQIATASDDGTARIWSLDGKLLQELSGHIGGVTSVSFSPDGQQIATGSFDSTVRIWSRDGVLLNVIRGHANGITSISFSPTSRQMATASLDRSVKVWSYTGEMIAMIEEIKGHQDEVRSVSFSPDGQQVATASYDGAVKIWTQTGELTNDLNLSKNIFHGMRIDEDSRRINTTASDTRKNSSLNHFGELSQLFDLYQNSSDTNNVSVSPDDQQIATASTDGMLRIWSRNGELLQELSVDQHGFRSRFTASFSPNGQQIVTNSNSLHNEIKTWQVYDLNELITLGCDWVRDYLTYNPEVSDEDRALCGIPPRNE